MTKEPLEFLKMVELTLREQLLTILQKQGPKNIAELARQAGVQRINVTDKLAVSKRRGHVKSQYMKKHLPWGGHTLVHVYQITKGGEEWLTQR